MKKILVTGANGQLGSELRDLSQSMPAFQFLFFTREDLDITDSEKLETVFSSAKPDYCINGSAYTAVDLAETEEEKAFLVNEKGVRNLAAVCKVNNTRLVHISTDYVFDGKATEDYNEDDEVSPQNVYGRSKLAGEIACMNEDPNAIIIRTSWLYSSHGKNFVKTMVRLMTEKEEIGVVCDQYGKPTYARDLAEAIISIIQSAKWKPGIYQYSNEGLISWHAFATEIRDQIGSACKVLPIPSSQYAVKAVRPSYSGMNTAKIVTSFSLEKKDWKNSLSACISRLRS